MSELWQSDLNLFRAIHHAAVSSAFAPVWLIITASGLAHVQIVAILSQYHIKLGRRGGWAVLGVGLLAIVLQGVKEGLVVNHCLAFALVLPLAYFTPKEALLRGIWGFAVGGVLHLAIKATHYRMRPSMLFDSHPLENVYSTASFPSGHTCTTAGIAFASAYYLFATRQNALACVYILWALLLGYSRIAVGVHWPSDVLAGLFIGLLAAGVVAWVVPIPLEPPQDLPEQTRPSL